MRIIILISSIVVVGVAAFMLIGAARDDAPPVAQTEAGNGAESPAMAREKDLMRTQENSSGASTSTRSDNSDAPSPYEQEAQRLQEQQQVIEQRGELTQESITAPYEQEIERLRAEREMLEERKRLEELKMESVDTGVPDNLPRPVTEF